MLLLRFAELASCAIESSPCSRPPGIARAGQAFRTARYVPLGSTR